MLPTEQKIHAALPHQEKFSLLVVSPHKDDRSAVSQILQNPCWRIDYAASLEDADNRLREKCASVILCETNLPDGSWKDLLARAHNLPVSPSVVVISLHANDDLWADVLSSGGYDVLSKPFDRRELIRVVGMAWRHCYTKRSGKSPSLSPVLVHAAAS